MELTEVRNGITHFLVGEIFGGQDIVPQVCVFSSELEHA